MSNNRKINGTVDAQRARVESAIWIAKIVAILDEMDNRDTDTWSGRNSQQRGVAKIRLNEAIFWLRNDVEEIE